VQRQGSPGLVTLSHPGPLTAAWASSESPAQCRQARPSSDCPPIVTRLRVTRSLPPQRPPGPCWSHSLSAIGPRPSHRGPAAAQLSAARASSESTAQLRCSPGLVRVTRSLAVTVTVPPVPALVRVTRSLPPSGPAALSESPAECRRLRVASESVPPPPSQCPAGASESRRRLRWDPSPWQADAAGGRRIMTRIRDVPARY
jgi:hypothetical protein